MSSESSQFNRYLSDLPVSKLELKKALALWEGLKLPGPIRDFALAHELDFDDLLERLCRYYVVSDNRAMTALLLGNGVDPNAGFLEAVKFGKKQIVELLLEKQKISEDNLIAAIKYLFDQCPINTSLLALLLKQNNVKIESKDLDKYLITALDNDSIAITGLLLNHGADINTNNGAALSGAIERNNPKMVDFLLGQGANPNIDKYILEKAARKGEFDIISALIDMGLDLKRQHCGSVPSLIIDQMAGPCRLSIQLKSERAQHGYQIIKRLLRTVTLYKSELNQAAQKAVKYYCLPLANLLVEFGADKDLVKEERKKSFLFVNGTWVKKPEMYEDIETDLIVGSSESEVFNEEEVLETSSETPKASVAEDNFSSAQMEFITSLDEEAQILTVEFGSRTFELTGDLEKNNGIFEKMASHYYANRNRVTLKKIEAILQDKKLSTVDRIHQAEDLNNRAFNE